MEDYIKLLLVSSALFVAVTACQNTPVPEPIDNLTGFEKSLVGSWRYHEIEINGMKYQHADYFLEPGTKIVSTIGKRTELSRKLVNYAPEKTYQLRWVDRGNYQLGTEGELNWQPSYGSWYHNPETDSVIHNIGLFYSVAYKITINSFQMTRISKRVMASDYDMFLGRPWDKGDTVVFREVFYRVDD